ncbi:MAG TPA: diacylglycerol kinase [Planctomycetaceae bacterium]|jgi:undecaprenol kinase|nr:diacylglycerol kinase [Planctomycetaceae bacterium]
MTFDSSAFAITDSARLPRSSRPAWRQRLVDAERGVMQGIRSDSAFFVYFFLSSATIAACVVLGISLIQWTIVILALTLVLSAEMFNQVLKALLTEFGQPRDDAARAALRMAVAAVFVAITGSVIVIGLILGQAAVEMFGGG